MADFTLADLDRIIEGRARDADTASSYTAKLLAAGVGRSAKKFGEEAVEAALAAVSGSKAELTAEAADVLYHLLVMLASRDVMLEDVLRELERREGQSGIAEKQTRV